MRLRHAFRAVTAVALAAAMGGCGDGLTELNVNPNQPVSVSADFLLPAAIVSGVDQLQGAYLNMDMVGLWVQHYAEHRYTDEDRYYITDSHVSGRFNGFYSGPLRNLYEVIQKGQEDERPNVVAVGPS
jgi:hypothetical protein